METLGPPRFLDEPPYERALFFNPGRTQRTRPLRCLSVAAELLNVVGSREMTFSRLYLMHGSFTRCLRFAG